MTPRLLWQSWTGFRLNLKRVSIRFHGSFFSDVSDSPVALAATRVANIFQSRLYNALLDIQEYYELHLNNKDTPQQVVSSPSLVQANFQDPEFDIFRITLEKSESGLGFSITGGIDSPVDTGDIHIYISKIIPGGAAEQREYISLISTVALIDFI